MSEINELKTHIRWLEDKASDVGGVHERLHAIEIAFDNNADVLKDMVAAVNNHASALRDVLSAMNKIIDHHNGRLPPSPPSTNPPRGFKPKVIRPDAA